jgi:hypothetical protein
MIERKCQSARDEIQVGRPERKSHCDGEAKQSQVTYFRLGSRSRKPGTITLEENWGQKRHVSLKQLHLDSSCPVSFATRHLWKTCGGMLGSGVPIRWQDNLSFWPR